MPKISIIIRCYNEEKYIGRLLSGIMQQTISNVEIIVVDSGSTDATLAIASRYPVKIVSIKSTEFSFGRSLNLGCEAASGDILVIASAHVYPVYRDWLETLIAPFQDEKIALTYGKQRGNEITKYSEQQIFAQWFGDSPNLQQSHPFCNNANAAIRRSLWEQLPYDETLTGLEDLDWAKRVLKMGLKIAYIPQAEIIHVHDETPLRTYNRYRREAIALKHIFPQEKFSFWDFFRLWVTNMISDYFYAARDGVLKQNLGSIFIFRLMQFWGTYQGYQQRDLLSHQLRQTFYYPREISPQPDQKQREDSLAIDYSQQEKVEQKI
jgi:rhamnosyltransferase